MRLALRIVIAALPLVLIHHAALARHEARPERVRHIELHPGLGDATSNASVSRGLSAAVAAETTWLYSANFGVGGQCSAQGWTSVDLTQAEADYWHVDDYAGLPFGPIEGAKSLWLGTRAGSGDVKCRYATLPGYGNAWNQSWCTKNCLPIDGGPTTNLDVSFAMRFDSEPSYDTMELEYTNDCAGNNGWTQIDGGYPSYPAGWSGIGQVSIDRSYAIYGGGPVKVRLHFTSDASWSDQDGLYNSASGAAHVDSLKAETLPLELFEDEPVGAISSNDWQSCNTPGFGDRAELLHGSELLQQDPCQINLSCLWAFLKNSTENYACGGHPEQTVIPHVNARGEYISNEIWSPWIPITDAGKILNLQFSVYRDLKPENQMFYIWHVRTLVNGCPTNWRDRNFIYYGENHDWFTHTEDLGALVSVAGATHVQVALGALDMCPFHCSPWATGDCHSHAPLFDSVKIYSVNISGPHWSMREIDNFQDTFPADGSATGKGRADSALDVKPSSSPTVTPGDSAVALYLKDPVYSVTTNISGLLDDPNVSTFIGRHKTKKQVYMYVAVWPQGQAGKVGAPLSEGPGGQANRYPFMGTQIISGVTWTKIRMDYTYSGSPTNPGNGHPAPNAPGLVDSRFNVDLNDNLFEAGDTVCYFYGATSAAGTTYFSSNLSGVTFSIATPQPHFTNPNNVTTSIDEAAANPMEFTILPAGGWRRGGHVLYVDGADGHGDQPYFEGAFLALGIADKVDRFDVRDPSADMDNTLADRVKNVATQLTGIYNAILWDCGGVPVTLNGGMTEGSSDKSDEYGLLNQFLAGLPSPGGVYLCGDDIAQQLGPMTTTSATTFKNSYMPFTLANGDHMSAGLGVSPVAIHWPGRSFIDDFVTYGGCPEFNDFDVLAPTGSSQIEMSYTTSQGASGAVLSHVNGNARVILSGFSLAFIRDDETNGISDRAQHLHDILAWLNAATGPATPAGPMFSNHLAQNYPNPFNPQTTIAFSIARRADVRLAVYDVNGALVRTLANEARAAGAYEITWDGRDARGQQVSSGVYFYRLVAGDFRQTRKMVLLK